MKVDAIALQIQTQNCPLLGLKDSPIEMDALSFNAFESRAEGGRALPEVRGGASLGDGQQQPAVIAPGVEVRAGQCLGNTLHLRHLHHSWTLCPITSSFCL